MPTGFQERRVSTSSFKQQIIEWTDRRDRNTLELQRLVCNRFIVEKSLVKQINNLAGKVSIAMAGVHHFPVSFNSLNPNPFNNPHHYHHHYFNSKPFELDFQQKFEYWFKVRFIKYLKFEINRSCKSRIIFSFCLTYGKSCN